MKGWRSRGERESKHAAAEAPPHCSPLSCSRDGPAKKNRSGQNRRREARLVCAVLRQFNNSPGTIDVRGTPGRRRGVCAQHLDKVGWSAVVEDRGGKYRETKSEEKKSGVLPTVLPLRRYYGVAISLPSPKTARNGREGVRGLDPAGERYARWRSCWWFVGVLGVDRWFFRPASREKKRGTDQAGMDLDNRLLSA